MLRVCLLDGFGLSLDGQPINAVNTPRLQSVLAYLILQCGTAQPRQQVATAFWPDVLDGQARNNLRQTVHQLRQMLPDIDRYLHADANTLRWCADTTFSLDVTALEDAVAQAGAARKTNDWPNVRVALESATRLYVGDLLPSCYDDWIGPERERLRTMFLGALKHLVELFERQRDIPSAIPYAQRLVEADPLDDEAQTGLMRLHALNHDRTNAVRVYQAYAATLKDELGIEPSQAMRDGYERLLRTDVDATTPSLERRVIEVPSPLIGRQPEWERLRQAWQQAARGQAHIVLVSGEAGIGKSRLAEELMMWAGQQGIGLAHARAYAAEGRLAYAPATEWLRNPAIYGALLKLDKVWLSEVARILPEILIERTDVPKPDPVAESSQRQHLFEALARAVLAANPPLLLVVDDLQWCDVETLEWLRYLLRFDASAKLLIVGTVRSEEVDAKHPLMRLLLDLRNASEPSPLTEIELKRLDAAESARLASHILNRNVELTEAMRLYSDTEGNPLFIVEMARAGLGKDGKDIESDDGATLRLPPRVHAVMVSRLAQLSEPALELAGLGATIGRAFSVDVLAQASGADEESLLRSLDELWQRRIVRAQEGNTYDFTHDKLRDVAYAQLGPAKQRLLHRWAARAIETVYAGDLDSVSAQLAAQYEQAGEVVTATTFFQRAGDVALRLYASTEAVPLYSKGLHLLRTLPQTVSRDERELHLLTQLNAAFGTGNSFQTLNHFDLLFQIQTISKRLGKSPNPRVLRSLATNYIIRAMYQESIEVGEQLIQLARNTHDPSTFIDGHEALGITYFWIGDFDAAHHNFNAGIKYFDHPDWDRQSMLYVWDSAAISRCRHALNLCCLGYPEQALRMQAQAIEQAEITQHPFTCGYTWTWSAWLSLCLQNHTDAIEYSDIALELSKRHGLLWWLHYATISRGWGLAAGGNLLAGIAEIQKGLEGVAEMKSQANIVFLRALLAEQFVRANHLSSAFDELGTIIEMAEKSGERWYLSEIFRMYGDALLASDAAESEAEAIYQRAIALAQQQSAKFFELRAATSLARLWQSRGKVTEARKLLQPVYNWFTEGFDTHDLKQAKALLDALSASL